MDNQQIFDFKTDISGVDIPSELNNPFGGDIPEIAKIATEEFQDFIALEAKNWNYDFRVRPGKMFGVLVVQKEDKAYHYLGTVSGYLARNTKCERFVPTVFDDSIDDYFINRGMTEVTEIGTQIKNTTNPDEIILLKEKRRAKSIGLQQKLFENYSFLNLSGIEAKLLEIFKHSSYGPPMSATGECAAPKLLQYAIMHQLKPIALAEFWWGNPIKEREHKVFYPACKSKCRPILQYMLEDTDLYDKGQM